MPAFKTTRSIFNSPWAEELEDFTTNLKNQPVPPNSPWNESRQIELKDIKLWEQIYYSSGNIGIYAAWDPYAEFYMIVFNLLINTPAGIEIYYGPTAADDVWLRAKQFGVDLKSTPS